MKHIRITYTEYDDMIETCEAIKADTHNNMADIKRQFLQEDDLPSIENLEMHDIEEKIGDYLPYFIYYSEVYEPKEETKKEFKEIQRYIRKILYKKLIFVDEEDFLPIEGMTKEKWKTISGKEEIMSQILSYYDADELSEFLNDMGKYTFFEEGELANYFKKEKKI